MWGCETWEIWVKPGGRYSCLLPDEAFCQDGGIGDIEQILTQEVSEIVHKNTARKWPEAKGNRICKCADGHNMDEE